MPQLMRCTPARTPARSARAARAAARRGPRAAATTPAPPEAPPPPSWTPLPVPSSLPELLAAVPAVASAVSDAQSAQYWAYALGRGAFFTAQALAAATAAGSATVGRDRLARQGVDFSAGDAAGLRGLLGSQAELYRRDLDNIKAGLYRAPYDADPRHRQFQPGYIADQAARLVRATAETQARRGAPDGGRELLRTTTDAAVRADAADDVAADRGFVYPDYYLQNFHWQTDGWMSVRSARSYEYATETLFQGAQDAMQRAALAPLGRYMASRAPEATRLLEVAAGTGRFHTFVKDNWPAMRTTCTDLSPYYLAAARENVEYFAEFNALVNPGRQLAPTAFAQCAAEALPYDDASFDVLMNVYLFHELPADVRAAVAREFARVVRPGGLCVINDSLQAGDRPADMDAVLPLFSANYHEPYHLDYTQTDMAALFQEAGFDLVSTELAHVSKVWAFVRR